MLRLREWDVNIFGDINAAANLFSRSYSCLYLMSPLEGPLSSPQEFQVFSPPNVCQSRTGLFPAPAAYSPRVWLEFSISQVKSKLGVKP